MSSPTTSRGLERGRALRNIIISHTIDFARVAIFQRCLDPGIQHDWPRRTRLDFRLLGKDDFHKSEIFRQKNRRERFVARLGEGHKCLGFVSDGGEVRSYLWLSCGSDGVSVAPFEAGLKCQFDARTSYMWDCRTAESHRRQGLYREGLERLQTLSKERGAEFAFIVSRAGNRASKKGILAAGFEKKYVMTIVKIANRPSIILIGKRVHLVRSSRLFVFQRLNAIN